MDDYGLVDGRVFGQPLSANIKQNIIEINELNILANFKPEDTYLILNHSNQFKIAKISKVVELPVLEQGKKKFPKIITFTFVDGSGIKFDLSKSFNGTLDDWKDMGGELFTKYRIFHLIEQEDKSSLKEIENLEKEVEKLLKSKSIFDSNLTIINEERPNIKINLKEKYLKYKAKYLQLKNQLDF
jgi:hypothetical protein